MEERRVELEQGVRVGGYDLFAIALVVLWPIVRAHCSMAVLYREALGVIVRDSSGLRVLMADGRQLSTTQLVAEHPSLRDAVSAL